jgi:serine protease
MVREFGSRLVARVFVSVAAVAVAGAIAFSHSPVADARERAAAQDLAAQRALARANALVEAAERGLNYLPGEVVVKFKPGTTTGRAQRALTALRSRPDVSTLEWHGDVAVLRDPSQPDAHVLAQQLREQPEVEFAAPNYLAKKTPFPRVRRTGARPSAPSRNGWITATPNDPDFSAFQWNFTQLQMPRAWDLQPGGTSSIIIAIVDTGVTTVDRTYNFRVWTGSTFQTVQMPVSVNPDLPASRHVAPRDFVFPRTEAVVDFDGHGTHVSGTAAEEAFNASFVAGIAYRARIMPVKVCTGYWETMIARGEANIPGFVPFDAGGCPFTEIADGIRYAADNGAKVINVSLGGEGAFTPLRDAISYAISRGAFVAISMGNEFDDGNPTSYPARYAMEFEGAVAVAATSTNETRAFYSNTGSHTELAAPGGDSSTSGAAHSGVIWQSTLDFFFNDPSVRFPRFDVYDIIGYQGTSMAAPHVSGLAALLIAQSPGITPAQIEKVLIATAKDIGASGRDDSFGHGLIQPRAALFGRGIAK